MRSADVEARTQQLGRALLDCAARYRPGPGERLEDWLLTRIVADERLRGRALRYLDVLPALEGSGAAKRLAGEYLAGEFPALPRWLRAGIRVARSPWLPAPVVAAAARGGAAWFARRFITPPGEESVAATASYLARRGRLPSFDLLGEAVLSQHEAEDYLRRYLELIARLGAHPAARRVTPAGTAQLQVSLKLSSLTHPFSPVDPDGSARRAREPLEALCEAGARAGVGITIDMEQYALRDLSWDVFRQTFGPGERFGGWPHAGIVLQAYLRDAEAHGDRILAFARERGTPFQVRLVKGAYWDFEVIEARAQRWPPPVHVRKGDTDRCFERLLDRFLTPDAPARLAVGSHNARAHAVAEALAEARGLATGRVEHQTLFRTAEGTSRALGELGWVARDYVPVGELLPGMAYLVRRVLENSSQVGFLLQSRGGASPDELLAAPPQEAPAPVAVAPDDAGFERAPGARWFEREFRERFDAALEETRAGFGERVPLRLAGEPWPGARFVAIRSPSHPDGEPVGHVAFADPAAAGRAVAIAAASEWGATPVEGRAAILERAAALLEEQRFEFAARVVHEGGRDRADALAEVEEAIDALRWYAHDARRLFAEWRGRIAPRGVTAVIPPWNFPLAIPCAMTGAALACGNAVVLKPAEQTPLVALHLAALLHRAGVPADALTCLPGEGEKVGAALASDPRVAMVAFTGSRAVGTLLHETVARSAPAEGPPRALVAEMGGKNPILVFADADLDEAVEGVLRSAFGHANQKCSAASRVLVESPLAERFCARLVAACRSLRVGPADDPATQMNPIIDREAWRRLAEAAERARAEGEVLYDGFELPGEAGLLRGPLLVRIAAQRAAAARTAREELFGPILAVIPFADEEEAYRIANDSAYGLTAGVFSRSPRTVARAARRLEAGNIYVNRPTTGARVGIEPFGGLRLSGTGPKAWAPDYLWAFVRRSDAPTEDPPEDPTEDPTGSEPPAAAARAPARLPEDLAERWSAPLALRLELLERAAESLAPRDEAAARALRHTARAARRELGEPAPTPAVAGQRTELWYATPRGRALVRAGGRDAAAWLGAVLACGNGCLVFPDPALDAAVEALRRAGVPPSALQRAADGAGASELLALAGAPEVAFVAASVRASGARALALRLGPTAPGQRQLKALLTPLEGPQPGEPGFVRRFAWPKLVAVRTLRHGTRLELRAPGLGGE